MTCSRAARASTRLRAARAATRSISRISATAYDTITGFLTGLGGDVLDVADLLVGFVAGTSDLADFVECDAGGGNTTVKVDADGAVNGAAFTAVCTLTGVTTSLDALVAGNNIDPGG